VVYPFTVTLFLSRIIFMLKKMISIGKRRKKKVINHRVKVRVKVRKKLFKKVFIVLAGLLLVGGFFLSLKTVYVFASAKIKSGIFSLEIKSVDIKVGDEKINHEILAMFKDRVGYEWNNNFEKEIKTELLSKHPYINNLSISKNILTGKLKISGKLEKIVSKIVLNNKEYYLALSGKLFLSAYENAIGQTSVPAEISLDEKPKLKLFAEFMNEINLSHALFGIKPILVKYNLKQQKCSIVLEDNSLVNWGKFELTESKILGLNRVLGDAAKKMPAPHKIDLKHFNIGKIFISEL